MSQTSASLRTAVNGSVYHQHPRPNIKFAHFFYDDPVQARLDRSTFKFPYIVNSLVRTMQTSPPLGNLPIP
jgi:hypothetical protein